MIFRFKKYASYAEKKKRNKVLKIGGIILVTTVIVTCVFEFVIMDYYQKKVRQNTIAELTEDNSGFVQCYILTKDIKQGDSIDATILQPATREKSSVPVTALNDVNQIKNMVSRINLSQSTIISMDMLTDMNEKITDEVKNQDFNWIRIHAFLQKGDYIDIHYKELDGTDTIVAAKKKVTNLSGNIFSTDITETERDYINNATVQAAVTGGELYTSIYPDPENQNPAEVTYSIDANIQHEIDKDPSVINKSAKTLSKNSENTDTATKKDKPNFAGGNN
ncbi:SAF domain-containing protein [uncultured Clostridium sp.]|uniref:SAF domain-containing protein n=1 Tax=uncultured Clostridium sp. TaxID=59620 RepID=UPI0028EA22E8|nr:SAF domain-containing protein [uncultured Clostridium sp.]